MEMSVWPDGHSVCGSCAGCGRKIPVSKRFWLKGPGSECHERITGKKVVSPRARRQVVRATCSGGLRIRCAAWLCSTPHSALSYQVPAAAFEGDIIRKT